jgi:NAD(P)-dependent dehydrogenase (short-subunit alcohol dehydrogenase family)
VLTGKVAVVTGGASGLGRATARALAEAGARVLVVDVDDEGARAVADEIGGRHLAADVSTLEANLAWAQHAQQHLGGVDLVHLNAGLASGCGIAEDFDLERYRRVMGVNLDGVVFGAHAAIKAMSGAQGGAIVATASLAGLTSVPFDPIYAANKHAVVGLVRSLGPSLAERNIRINAVCPGFAESRIIDPIRQFLSDAGMPIIPAERIAETVVRLFSGEETGEAWYVQAGRPAEAFGFRGIPGTRDQ